MPHGFSRQRRSGTIGFFAATAGLLVYTLLSRRHGLITVVCFRLEKRGKSLEDFDYSNEEIMKEIYTAMNATNFVGVSV